LSELSQWRKKKGLSQQEMAKKLGYGTKWSTYAAQERGDNSFSAAIEAKLRAMEFHGRMPQEETKSPAQGDSVTRAEFEVLRADLEDACEVIRFLLTQLPAESRPGVLPKRFR
jgi:transcriptional regulator with XRE-family HTH domain